MKWNKTISSIINIIQAIPSFLGLTTQTVLIFQHAIQVNAKTKRFIITAIILLFPVFLRSITIQNVVIVEKSNEIAMYQMQLQLLNLINTWWLSTLGELMIIVIASDIISGELENETLHALYLRPVRSREIIIGKFLANLTLIITILATGVISSAILEAKTYGADNIILLHATDEILYTIFILILSSSLIIALTELFSTLTGKTLQTVLLSISVIIGIELLASLFGFSPNTIQTLSLTYYTNDMLQLAYFNLDFKTSYFLTPHQAILSFLLINILIIIASTYVLSLKELP